MKIPEQSSEKENQPSKAFKYDQCARDKMCRAFLELENGTIFFKFAYHKNTLYAQSLDAIDTSHYSILEQTTYDDTSEPKLGIQEISRLSAYISVLFGITEKKWLQTIEPELEKRYIFTVVISEWKIVKIVREKSIKNKRKASLKMAEKIDTILSSISLDIDLDNLS
jgi:hypothetical protein